MNISWFIAQRIVLKQPKSFSKFIIHLSILAIGISVSVMIIAMSFINGFQHVIQQKAFAFWGHIRVENFLNDSIKTSEIKDVEHILTSSKDVDFVQPFIQKYGLIISPYSLEGLVFKGYDHRFNEAHFKHFIHKGRWINTKPDTTEHIKEIVISEVTAKRLKLDTGQTLIAHFIEPNQVQKKRKLRIVGLYKTGIEEYDQTFCFVDMQLIQRLNGKPEDIDGFEVFVHHIKKLKLTNKALYQSLPTNWNTRTIKEIIGHLFEWLELLNVNKWILIIILSCVAGMNIVVCMITFVLERSRMIGILKTLGMPIVNIQKIFITYTLYVLLFGLLLGLGLGIGFCVIQDIFGLIRLDENVYFLKQAPVKIDALQILILFVGMIVFGFLVALLPSYYIQRLNPVKSIRIKS